jgi:hypothetical protein
MKINVLKTLSYLVGAGLLGGSVGTLAITGSMQLQKKLQNLKGAEDFPADVVEKVLGITVINKERKILLASAVHWVYGTTLGLLRSFLVIIGIRGMWASLFHAIVTQLLAMLLIPKLMGIYEKLELKKTATQFLHHCIYSLFTGLIADNAMKGRNSNE